MRNCFHNALIAAGALGIVIFNAGCSSQIEAPKIDSSKTAVLNTEKKITPAIKQNNQGEINLEEETQIEKQCLQAWRNCIAGKKQEAMQQLETLAKQYPKSSSVLFMTGQVLERSGKKTEAIAYYEKSLHNSDFATMSLFKLAESLRTTGNTKKAIIRYRELIAISPDFPQAHIGLAKALKQLDPKSAEAISESKLALKLDPNNKEAAALVKAGG